MFNFVFRKLNPPAVEKNMPHVFVAVIDWRETNLRWRHTFKCGCQQEQSAQLY